MGVERLHAYVSGRVQGVFFRSNTRKEAKKLGLSGWVRNLSDGRVEVVAEGERELLEELLRYLHRGPSFARVDKVEAKFEKATGEFKGFEVRY